MKAFNKNTHFYVSEFAMKEKPANLSNRDLSFKIQILNIISKIRNISLYSSEIRVVILPTMMHFTVSTGFFFYY